MRKLTNSSVCFVALCGVIVILCLVSCVGAGFHCVEPSQVHSSNKCYRRVNSNSSQCQDDHYSCKSNRDAIQWTSLNSSSGLIEVSFLLASPECAHTMYRLTLEVHADATKEECQDISSEGFKVHSRRDYIVEEIDALCARNNSCSMCEKTGSVKFQFVFSGCYQLRIEPMVMSEKRRQIRSCPVFLESIYKKALITEQTPPHFWQDPGDQNSPVTLYFRFDPLSCSLLGLEIRLVQGINTSLHDHSCYKSGKEHSKCNIGINGVECKKTERPGTTNDKCQIAGDKVSCEFEPIKQGQYCAIMKIIDDDRCAPDTLWTLGEGHKDKPCTWHEEFPRGGSVGSEHIEEDPSQTYALFGGIMVIALAVALVGVWLKVKHTKTRRLAHAEGELGGAVGVGGVEGTDGGTASPSRTRRGVLLLYARDCEPFMHLMQSFRRLLEDAVKLEVYDCFDTRRWEQVSRNPTEWVRRLALHPEVKVIAVASSCASLRLEAQLTNTHLHYAQPTSMDDLFVYALQLLGDNVQRDNGYQKMFIVRFDGFSDDLDLFTHLNSYTRYVMPAHYDLLVNSLHPNPHDQSLQLMEHNQVQTICRDLKKLVHYKKENENYLEDYLLIRKCS